MMQDGSHSFIQSCDEQPQLMKKVIDVILVIFLVALTKHLVVNSLEEAHSERM